MYLVTKKELDLKKETALNFLACNKSNVNKSQVIQYLEELEYIDNLRFTKVKKKVCLVSKFFKLGEPS